MSTRHVLVTGGAGFIGSHLVERLLRQGCTVTVIDDCSTGSVENLRNVISDAGFRFIQGKVSECRELTEIIKKCQFIYHLAAAVGVELVVHSPIRTIQTNLRETEAVLEAAAENGVPLLVASTSEVYGKSQQPAFDENDDLLIGPPHLGRWSYACSKLMDEFLAFAHTKESGIGVIVVRLFNTVGPRQIGHYGMVLPRFISAALADQPLKVYGDGSQTRCFCYVMDTIEALIRLEACSHARGEVFNVGSTEEVSILHLAELVIQTLSSKSKIEFVPYQEAYAQGFEDMLRRKPVVEKLSRAIQFLPSTPLKKIIEVTAEHLR